MTETSSQIPKDPIAPGSGTPLPRNTERFRHLSPDPAPVIPEGTTGELLPHNFARVDDATAGKIRRVFRHAPQN